MRIDFDLTSILGYVLVGLVVGLIARFVVPGSGPVGLLGTLLIGISGAVLGGWLAGALFEKTAGIDWIASIAVAAILVLLIRAGSRRRATFGRRWLRTGGAVLPAAGWALPRPRCWAPSSGSPHPARSIRPGRAQSRWRGAWRSLLAACRLDRGWGSSDAYFGLLACQSSRHP